MSGKENIKNRVQLILEGSKKIIYPPADDRSANTQDGNTLYLLTKEQRDALIVLEKEAEVLFELNPKKSALWSFVRFLNPYVCARLFNVKVESKHTQIDDQKKVFREIDSRLYFEEKRIIGAMNDSLNKIKEDELLREKIRREATLKIRNAQVHNIILKKYRGALKMRVSGLKKKRFYNELTFYLYPTDNSEIASKESRKRRSGHLSIDTPTALWYEPQEKKIHESDQKFINEAIDASYGDIYYIPLASSPLTKQVIQQEVEGLLAASDIEFEEIKNAYRSQDL
ncbi:MAG: hypothetical protein PHE67_07765 [Campylobacterales bacterium]|nr:hypothetical protein [Campylobacterales bacterium]